MKLLSKEDVELAQEMGLLTYLTYHEPDNLRHVSGSTYCTAEHDSLIINNGKWCWFSQGIGGRNALDYLIKVNNAKNSIFNCSGTASAVLTCPY